MTDKLSVVIVPLTGGQYLERCLNALGDRHQSGDVEIIVPFDDRFSSIAGLQQKFPKVRMIRMNGSRTYAELRAFGFLNATAPLIALTEDQCIPDPDWCSRIVEAHRANHAVIGGVVDKYADLRESVLSWALYFCDYSRYANPVLEGVVPHLTDCNVSYKREALMSVSRTWELEFHETVVHAALQEQGKALWLSPGVIVKQHRSMDLTQALRERYRFGRLFGSTRVKNAAMHKRLMFAALAMLLPLLLTGRIAKNVYEKKRYRRAFVRSLPMIFLLNVFWSFGEGIGYLTGAADPSLSHRQAPI